MDQHPIPRQITTFEFKLIGFMTLKQFLYLVVFFPLGYVLFALFPVPILNIILALLVAGIGLAFAFFQIQERPLDIWLKNLFKRLRSPSQYFYKKQNQPLPFLKGLYFQSDPHIVMAHIDSQEKLAAYLARKKNTIIPNNKQKENIQNILRQPFTVTQKTAETKPSTIKVHSPMVSSPQTPIAMNMAPSPAANPSGLKQPFLTGVIRNNRQIALPGILVYIKDQQSNTLRLLKTNPHGVFATYSPLPVNEYLLEMKDPNAGYFFDTMKIQIEAENPTPLKLYSKELL